MIRRIAIGLFLIGFGVSGVIGSRSYLSTIEKSPSSSGTKLFDQSRLRSLWNELAAEQQIGNSLAKQFGHTNALECGNAVMSGREVFSVSAQSALIPASTIKLATGIGAMELLGPNYRMHTRVFSQGTGSDVAKLYVVGGGDSLLATDAYAKSFNPPVLHTSLDALAEQVANSGVRRVDGLVIDTSRYDNVATISAWDNKYGPTTIAALSAWEVNHGLDSTPAHRPIVGNANLVAAKTFAGLLRQHGVVVSSAISVGTLPAATVIERADMPSAPLTQVVNDMWQNSDNLTAELLVKEVAAHFGGVGTTAAGINRIRTQLDQDNFDLDGFTQIDGSGLATQDRVSCQLLTQLVQTPQVQAPNALAIAGESGTLQKRLTNTSAAGTVHAKTGTLTHAAALTGFVSSPGSQPLDFAFISNNAFTVTSAHSWQDGIALMMANSYTKSANAWPTVK